MSIIVVNWNTKDLLSRCLQCVYASVGCIDCEVFVVDNGSRDGSIEMVSQCFPQIRLIANRENLGFARANNQAIQKSKGSYILLLNSDAFITEDAIQQMVSVMDAHPEAGIVGVSLAYPDSRPQVSHGPLPTLQSETWSLLGMDKGVRSPKKTEAQATCIQTGYVGGSCLMVRRSMLNQIGILDESFFFFSEEIDLCYRANRAGWKVLHIPCATVVHVGGGTTGNTAKRVLMLYRGKLLFFSKHYGKVAEQRLLRMMRFASRLKTTIYSLLRWISLGKIRKDGFWRAVSSGLDMDQV